jgi:hypothetical protein
MLSELLGMLLFQTGAWDGVDGAGLGWVLMGTVNLYGRKLFLK